MTAALNLMTAAVTARTLAATCTECGESCESEDSYSDCCNEPVATGTQYSPYSNDPDGYDRNGAFDGHQVYSDAEGCL
jgi:hypothetical protein